MKAGYLAAALVLFAGTASANVLYENGSLNGTWNGFAINHGASVTNSFTLSDSDHVRGITFGSWSSFASPTIKADWVIAFCR